MPWFRWLVSAFAIAFPVLFAAYLLRGQSMSHALSESLAWGAISAWVFVMGKINNVRRGRRCAACETLAE
ncbi:hypothetical protein LVB87_09000 [Lysobacter sp. KIS68-7]|uniref:hypothetical protein n=1 Tax=Lysobacter sp. KIS68-7 TaxID=2904252 RepID=UPI001E347315|nr:hypothetical protein [Lysobacter sp. KIS68-7]UHQ18360.1 hypothetical protein LVB87_09000 [Lysobacter sp. KIS68-7]